MNVITHTCGIDRPCYNSDIEAGYKRSSVAGDDEHADCETSGLCNYASIIAGARLSNPGYIKY